MAAAIRQVNTNPERSLKRQLTSGGDVGRSPLLNRGSNDCGGSKDAEGDGGELHDSDLTSEAVILNSGKLLLLDELFFPGGIPSILYVLDILQIISHSLRTADSESLRIAEFPFNHLSAPISTLTETTPALKHLSSLGHPSATLQDVITAFLQLQVRISKLVPRVDDSPDEELRRAWSS